VTPMPSLSPTEIFVAIVAVAGLVLVVVALVMRASRRRHQELVQRFGPEYERVVDEYGSEKQADRELLARERRIKRLQVHPLRERERAAFLARWNEVQARFFDDPVASVRQAEELIKAVMDATGYELDDFEQRVADLSVEHATVVQHYRAARALLATNLAVPPGTPGRPDVDELRQAVVHYRALFMDLVSEPELAPRGFFRPAHSR
jgi:hypothetical protein